MIVKPKLNFFDINKIVVSVLSFLALQGSLVIVNLAQ